VCELAGVTSSHTGIFLSGENAMADRLSAYKYTLSDAHQNFIDDTVHREWVVITAEGTLDQIKEELEMTYGQGTILRVEPCKLWCCDANEDKT
jgi:hypothetical protein